MGVRQCTVAAARRKNPRSIYAGSSVESWFRASRIAASYITGLRGEVDVGDDQGGRG